MSDTEGEKHLPPIDQYTGLPVRGHVGDLDVKEREDNHEREVCAFDSQGSFVAMIRVYKNAVNDKYDMIGFTFVIPAERGKGRMRALIDYYVLHHGPVLSDNNQSPEAKQVWQSLLRRPGTLKLAIYNAETDTAALVRYAGGEPQDDPWDGSLDTHILAENRIVTAQQARLMELTGRGFAGWYGRPCENNP